VKDLTILIAETMLLGQAIYYIRALWLVRRSLDKIETATRRARSCEKEYIKTFRTVLMTLGNAPLTEDTRAYCIDEILHMLSTVERIERDQPTGPRFEPEIAERVK
jgi:hypothetical protein